MGIDITLKRIEKKRRILEFIESKKIVQRKETKKREVLIQVDKRVQVPYVKKEETPKEYQKVYMADSKMRKQRKEKAVRSFSLSKDKDKLKNKVFLNGGTNENVSKVEKKTSRQKVKSEQSAVEKERLVSSRLKKKKEAKQAKLDEIRKQKEEAQRQKEARLAEEKRIKEEKLRQRQESILKEKEAKQAKLDEIRRQKEDVQRQKKSRLIEEKRIKEEKLNQRQDNKTKLIGFIASVQKNRKLIQQEKFLEKAALIADKKLQQKQTKQAGLDKKKEARLVEEKRIKEEKLRQRQENILKEKEAKQAKLDQVRKQKEALLAEKRRAKEEELRQRQELTLKEKEAKQAKLDETRKQREEIQRQKESRLDEEKRIKEEKLRQRQELILKEKEAKQAKLDQVRKQKDSLPQKDIADIRQDNKTKLIGFIASVQKNRKLTQQEKFLEKAALIADKKLQQKQIKQAGLDKKKELADLRLKRREATRRIDSEQALKQKEALLAEKKRAKEEELRQKQELILKEKEAKQVKLDETREQKEEVKQQEILELADKEVLKQKEEKLSVVYKKGEIFSKNLLAKREGERRRLLSRLLNDKEVYRKRVASPDTKIEIEKPSKKPVTKLPVSAVSKEKQKEVNIRLAELQKESAKISRASLLLTKESVLALRKFIPTLRKKKKEILSKQALAKTRPVAELRKEPFQLVPFVRKNAFKIVFVLLLIVWLLEMFLFSRGARDATARLKFITGEEPYQQKRLTKQRFDKSMDEETALVEQIFVAGEKIDIEGKRDPFSPGRLTMEVLERPTLTNIVLASKPEVISILRAPKTVSILREEKPIEPPKSVDLPKTEPPKITPVSVAKLSEVPQPLKTTPLEKVSAPKVTPLIVPEMRCDLIFRGKMLFEGVEYLFIEGRQKTYRVTVGDIVEGFRILRKEKDRLYLSKDGISYEIKID